MKCFLLSILTLAFISSASAIGLYRVHPLSEREVLQTYTNILWDAVRHSDQFWHEWPVDSRGGMWGSGRSDNMNEGIRAISEMVFVSGVLSRYACVADSRDRRALVEKATAAMQYIVASHLTGGKTCTDGKKWGGSWQSAMWTGTMAFGVWLMWDELDPELQKAVERVVASESDRFLEGRPPGGTFNDTKAEENGWNMICLSVAANMFPNHPHSTAWKDKGREYMMNTLSAPQDEKDLSFVDGRQVASWFSGANVHPDFTLENHGFFHPSYIGCSSYFLTQAAMHYTFAHRPVPEAAAHHLLDTWHMFQPFILPTGQAVYPQGMDWELRGTPYINLFAALATHQRDAYAASMEQAFLQYMRAWQKMCRGDLTLQGSKLGFTRHAICAEQAAYGFLSHQLFGPAVKPSTKQEIAAQASGVRQYPYVQLVTHRTPQKFFSFSWTNRLMGMVIPIGPGHEDNPDFTVPIANGLVGSFDLNPRGETKNVVRTHVSKQTTDGLETSGTLLLNGGRLEQKLRVLSIGRQTVFYEDRVTALTNVTITQEHGIPIGIENDEVTGNTRNVSSEHGRITFDASHPDAAPILVHGSWANVDGRLGLVSLTGNHLAYIQARDYAPGISVKTDVLYGAYQNASRSFKAGDQVAHRAVLIYAEVSPKQTAVLARSLLTLEHDGGSNLTFALPEGGRKRLNLWTEN